METVPAFGGVFFEEATEEQLAAGIERFEEMEAGILPAELQVYARRFSEAEFARKVRASLDR